MPTLTEKAWSKATSMEKEPHKDHATIEYQALQSAVEIEMTAQPGVRAIEAVTVTWGIKALVAAYSLIWLTYFVEGMLSGTLGALNPYVTSAYLQQPLLPTVGIISSIVGGVTNLTIAKILDVFGRPHGLLACLVIAVVGLVMMAATNNVETYAAAQVFYTVGNNGLQYTLSVFVADTASLKNRGLMQAFAYSPYMITCWLAGPISSGFIYGPGWPWAFGMFAILVPAVTLPLFGLLMYQSRKSRNQDLESARETRSFLQSLMYCLRQFDAVGLLLLSGGVAMFLLPFNLYTLQATGWASPLIICLLVFGVVLLVAFVLWERYLAPITFIPWTLLKDRTVLGACILAFTAFFSNSCYTPYFGSFLQVVVDLSVTDASYVLQVATVGSVLSSLAAGAYIHYTGRFKSAVLFFGIPLSILGAGLLIRFRQPDQYVGYVVMCQIFISFGSGIVVICDEIAALAATDHQHIAVVIAALGLFSSIGAAIGYTVAAAIWQGVLPNKLLEYLPADALDNFSYIYGDINTQLSYDVGTPTRLAIQQAYGDTQAYLLTTSVAVWAAGIVGVLMWRNINVKDIKQVHGNVV